MVRLPPLRNWMQLLRARQSSFAIGSIVSVALNGSSGLLSALTSIVLARVLGVEQFGFVVLFTTLTNAVALFADLFGVYYANAYFTASQDRTSTAATRRGTVLVYGLVSGGLAGSLFVFAPLRLMVVPNLQHELWGILLAFGIMGNVLCNQIRGNYLGDSNFLAFGLTWLVQGMIYLVFAGIVIFGLGLPVSLLVAAAQVAAIFCTTAIFVAHLSRSGIGKLSLTYLRHCFHFGRRAIVVNWLSFLHTRIDQYLINTLLGPAALGVYSVAVALSEQLIRVPGVLGTVLFPTIAANQDRLGAARQTLRRTAVIMLSVTAVSLPLIVFAQPIITVMFGTSYTAAAPVVIVLMPAVIFLAGLLLINNHFAGSGYPPILLISMAIGLTANTLLNLMLLPRISVMGAALASSVSYGLQLLIAAGYLIRYQRRINDQ